MKPASLPKAPQKEALVLKNYHLRILFDILSAPLHGQEARSRNRVAKIFQAKFAALEEERMKLLEKYAKKDEKTKQMILDKTGKNYEMEDLPAFSKEYEEALGEDAIFDLLPSTRPDFVNAKKIVLAWAKPLTVAETDTYEEICQAFEKIK